MFSSPEGSPSWSRRSWILLAAGAALHAADGQDLRRVPPPDDPLDPALSKLLLRMRKIVADRDHASLEALMGPVFRVEFDVGKGPAKFHSHWHPESATSPVWEVLERLLVLPAHAYTGTLCAVPYVFSRFPFDLDPLQHVVAVKESAALLAEPRSDAKQLGVLNYSIVPLAQPLQPPVVIRPGTFLEVVHPVAGRGYTAAADIYHPAAHRAFFEKRGAQWRWISLAAATEEDPPELLRHKPANG